MVKPFPLYLNSHASKLRVSLSLCVCISASARVLCVCCIFFVSVPVSTLSAIESGIKWNKVSTPPPVFHAFVSQSTKVLINVVLRVIIYVEYGIFGIKRYRQKVER